jgi:hypothetical protein
MPDNSDHDGVSLDHRGLITSGTLAASVAAAGAMLSQVRHTPFGQKLDFAQTRLSKRDLAILRFLTVVEQIERDIWQQYSELGGATDRMQNGYQLALQVLDLNTSRQISNDYIDELSHARFLNEVLKSEGAEPVDLERFRTLRGSAAPGALNIGRLTNLMHLKVDTSWLARYRRAHDSESGLPESQTMPVLSSQSIPRSEADFCEPEHAQKIANVAVFHFGHLTCRVLSLYANLCKMERRAKVLRILLGIGGQEVAHFLGWIDIAYKITPGPLFRFDIPQTPIERHGPVLDECDTAPRQLISQARKIVSGCSGSLRADHPVTSLFPSVDDELRGAVAAIHCLTQDGIFVGQSDEFMRMLIALANEADDAISV